MYLGSQRKQDVYLCPLKQLSPQLCHGSQYLLVFLLPFDISEKHTLSKQCFFLNTALLNAHVKMRHMWFCFRIQPRHYFSSALVYTSSRKYARTPSLGWDLHPFLGPKLSFLSCSKNLNIININSKGKQS